MATNEEQEIYKQRYETFRHLDKLRWQMFQIAVTVGSLALVLGNSGSAAPAPQNGGSPGPNWWVLAVVGLLLLILGLVMERIRFGISINGRVLQNVAKIVGDVGVPSATVWWKNFAFWVAFTMMALGLLCIVLAFFRLCQ